MRDHIDAEMHLLPHTQVTEDTLMVMPSDLKLYGTSKWLYYALSRYSGINDHQWWYVKYEGEQESIVKHIKSLASTDAKEKSAWGDEPFHDRLEEVQASALAAVTKRMSATDYFSLTESIVVGQRQGQSDTGCARVNG